MKKAKAKAKLEARIVGYERANDSKPGPATRLHKPGSQRGHKK